MNRHRGRRRLLGSALAALGWFGGALALPAEAAPKAVDEVGTSFSPPQVAITVNDKVIWTNRSSTAHTVTFDGGPDLHPACDPDAVAPLRVGCQGPGATAELTFRTPGTYAYYCKIHRSAMKGTVAVSAAPPDATTTTEPETTTSSTLAKATTTTTAKATSSTTTTTRPLATSSTLASSSTTSTTLDNSSALLPGDPPPFSGDDINSSAAGRSGDNDGSDSTTVALIVALLLAVSAGGGYLLWRLRPGRP